MIQYDPNDPDQVEAMEALQHLRALEDGQIVRKLLDTYEGRYLFHAMMQKCALGQNPFCGEETHGTTYKVAQQQIGEFVRNLVFTHAPEKYNIILNEAFNRDEEYAARSGLTKLRAQLEEDYD